MSVAAPSVHNVQCAIEHIYPLVAQYRMDDNVVTKAEEGRIQPQMHLMPSRRNIKSRKKRTAPSNYEYDSDNSDFMSDTSEDEYDSDESQDWVVWM